MMINEETTDLKIKEPYIPSFFICNEIGQYLKEGGQNLKVATEMAKEMLHNNERHSLLVIKDFFGRECAVVQRESLTINERKVS